MKTIKDSLFSTTMGKPVDYVVVLPDSYESQLQKAFPVLYCLHGLGAPYETWSVMPPLHTAIDAESPTILVTFQGEASFYIDDSNDPSSQYTTFFFEELIPYIEKTYRAGGKKELRAVTGFSMGGFGAWHYMLQRPDFFSSVSSLSGAFDREPREHGEFNIYTQLQASVENKEKLPPMYIGCGVNDSLIEDNRRMHQALKKHDFSIEYAETVDAGHNWKYWNPTSAEIIAFHYRHFSHP